MQNPVPSETHHGIDFIDWAAANANIAFGMSVADVTRALGVEEPQWEAATAKWTERLGELITDDPEVATVYGQVFQNPAVGAFAKTAGPAAGPAAAEAAIAKINFEKFAEISAHVEVASEQGVDMQTVMRKDYGLTVGAFANLQMKYMQHEAPRDDSTALRDYLNRFEALKTGARPEFEQRYGGGAGTGLADDIEF